MKLSDKSSYELNLCLNTRCNYCRETCSVYEVSGMEFDSPRAKLELINEVLQDRVDPKEVMSALNKCTSCKKCVESCPYGIDISEILNEFRNLVKESEFKKNKHDYVVKTSYPIGLVKQFVEKGNPFGIIVREKPIDGNADFVFFPGCVAYHKDNELVDRTKAIFDKLGLNYSVVNTCCYSPLKNFGFSKKEISELFNSKYQGGGKRIVTLCAGCYDSLKNDHNKNVVHISQFLLDHVNKLKVKNDELVTYIDSCKLGRYNKIYNEPRKLLGGINGLKTFEINNNKEDSPCCGGGGSLQYNFPKISTKVSKNLLKQKAPGTTLVTACSYCKYYLTQNSNEKVKHLVDLIFESMS